MSLFSHMQKAGFLITRLKLELLHYQGRARKNGILSSAKANPPPYTFVVVVVVVVVLLFVFCVCFLHMHVVFKTWLKYSDRSTSKIQQYFKHSKSLFA